MTARKRLASHLSNSHPEDPTRDDPASIHVEAVESSRALRRELAQQKKLMKMSEDKEGWVSVNISLYSTNLSMYTILEDSLYS